MTEEVKKPGQPTKYDSSYCEKVIALGKLGKSFEQIAAQLDVSYRTIVNWRDTHEEFFHALEEAKIYEMVWWEEQAQAYMLEHKDAPKLNTGLWSRSMAARFPKKYSERIKQEVTGADGAPLLTGLQVSFVEAPEQKDE